MKKLMILAPILMMSSLAFAADVENSNTTTVDHSKNPITGTKKTVRKHKMKAKDGAGNAADTTITETTKMKTDGSMEKKTKVEGDESHK
jgi:hypothetical protein